MALRFLQLKGMTRVSRHEMISRVRAAILQGGGYILDFHMFSNAAICINFEVSAGAVGDFYAALAATGLQLEQESHELLAGCSRQARGSGSHAPDADFAGTLNITFIHNEPDLRIEVPPIPG